MIRKFAAFGLITLTLAVSLSSYADDKPTLVRQGDNAVRIAIVNGVINFVNNARQATVDLQWELLPPDDSLLDSARQAGVKPVVIEIDNSRLRDDKDWTHGVSQEKLVVLRKALHLPDKYEFDPKTRVSTLEASRQQFKTDYNDAKLATMAPSVSVTQVFGMMRDFQYLNALLQSEGVSYSVEVPDAKIRGENPRISDQDITWEIKLYEFTYGAAGPLYRCSLKAKVRPYPMIFTDAADTKAKLKVNFGFRTSKAFAGVDRRFLNDLRTIEKDLPQPTPEANQIEAAGKDLAPSSLETTLNLITGTELTDVVSKGLFGGTGESSFVTGGLFGKGKVSRVIGVNTDISRSGSNAFGYTLGVLPDDSKALFGGLSLQVSDVLLGVGMYGYEVQNSAQTRVGAAFRPAAMLSIDFSRLIGSKKQNRLGLDNAVAGGGEWRKSSNSIGAGLAAMQYTLTMATGETGTASLRWYQKLGPDKDGKPGDPIPEGTGYRTSFVTGTENKLLFFPRGTYAIQVPNGFDLVVPIEQGFVEAPTTPIKEKKVHETKEAFPMSANNSIQPQSWTVRHTPGQFTSADLPNDKLEKLVTSLVANSDIAKVVLPLMSDSTQDLLADYMPGGDHDKLRAALVKDLNRVIVNELLYDNEAFKAFYGADMPKIGPKTRIQLRLNRDRNSVRVKLNRLLLEDALIPPP